MLTEKIEKGLNDQLNAELYSAYIYLAMSAYFSSEGLSGFAKWMRAQAAEEMSHGMKFFDFILERGGRVELAPIGGPPEGWGSPLAAFEAALEHERKVTGLINDLMDLAIAERDHATQVFLQWFITEQVEEEDSVGDVVSRLRLVENAPGGLFMLDRELGQRSVGLAPEGE